MFHLNQYLPFIKHISIALRPLTHRAGYSSCEPAACESSSYEPSLQFVFRGVCGAMAVGFGAVSSAISGGTAKLGWVSVYFFILFSSKGVWGDGRTANAQAVNSLSGI